MKYISSLILLFPMWLCAQNISVQSFKLLPEDMTARITSPEEDQNGEKCAIIKVRTTQKGFVFEGDMLGITKVVQEVGEVWIYVPGKAKKLTIKHSSLGVLDNYIYPEAIKAATVYLMELTTGNVKITVEDYEIPTEWVIITSKPDKANIFINNESKGLTPFQQELTEGSYTYRLEYPLYHNNAGTFKVSKETGKQELFFELIPNFGSISIKSQPESGAQVLLDGKPTFKTTPCILTEISSEQHSISLQLEWYEPIKKTVTVIDGKTSDADIIMKPSFGNIKITADNNAEIFIDGTRMAVSQWEGRLISGIHTFEAKKQNYYSDKSKLEIIAGEDKTINLRLQPIYGKLKVITNPYGASIKLNGKELGSSPNTFDNLQIGSYTITLEKDGYGSVSLPLTIAENQTTSIEEILPSGKEITISTDPAGAQLTIDGIVHGSTPQKLMLSYGKHEIKLVKASRVITESIVISQENTKNQYRFDISEETEITFSSNPPGAEVRIDEVLAGHTPFVKKLYPGNYSLTFQKAGYKTIKSNLSVVAGVSAKKSFNLESKEVALFVKSSGIGGNVYSNGKFVGETNQDIKLPAGGFTKIKIKSPSAAAYTATLNMDTDKTINVSLYPKSSTLIGGEFQYNSLNNSFGYGGNLGFSFGHFFAGLGAGILNPAKDDFEVDVFRQNIETLSSSNYTEVGKFYVQDAVGYFVHIKTGLFTYKPFKLFMNIGYGYSTSPEFQKIYRANEEMTSGLYIPLNVGDYFTKPETSYFNSSYFISGISVPLLNNTSLLGLDIWFGSDSELIFNAQLLIPISSIK